ncbi:BTAD domain-containing putative transcriptional regulator [Mycobacterium sp. ITM-2016-00318]|uniref:BTAD domain-containing putative transcriptional regulator n=1 Tax=Mycobacterium sp. ITM-2016-00318 TaxID=2099693 RepID=UPI00287F6C0E|nr:BTAD domain-containing putative transcriptional regulator [Mycobacterium sp. ITM-2016-00318]WNG95526.1 BTAD domain-containing putative transcriptional regulator [Mycobacterium sp. ITM-2016-00318]
MELRVLGPLQARQGGAPVAIPGAKPRAILTMLGLHGGSVVSADTLLELLWGDDPPRTAGKALQTHISALRRTVGDGIVLTLGTGWILADADVDATRYKIAARLGRDAAASGDTTAAVAAFEEALSLWRGIPELPDSHRGSSEKTRWIEAHAALVEDRADALLATGRAAEIAGELEAAVGDAPLRERRWGQLMLALYRAGRQGEALGAYQRARSMLADQLGVDPGPELRRLEAAIVGQDAALEMPVAQQASSITRAVTFLLTDIEGSTAAWESDADAMAVALARHDELVEQVVTSRGGRLIKARGEGDATFSVFDRPSTAAAAAIELQDAVAHEPWPTGEPLRIRVALHTGEVELRDGDYFGRAVNRAARLRSLASGGQILCSGATAELVIDSLTDDVVLADLGVRQLRNLARPEHVFELRMQTADDEASSPEGDTPVERPDLPALLTGHGPFVGRGQELQRLSSTWQSAVLGGMRAVLIAGEPGVGKTRLAGEWSRRAYEDGAVVLYGRCDEDLGAPYQPFAEALRSLVPCLSATRLRALRGVEALLPLVPGLADVLPDLAAPTRADPDTERYALFDAVVALLESASTAAPVVLILDDLHWAAKSTLLLLRHLLRFGDQAQVRIVGTYRSTDLDRSHPLAATLADLHRDGTAERLQLGGLDEDDVTAYVAEAGYDDEELGRALASVTGGNPFFLIEALRHVDESGGVWDQSTLPQGVREAVSRRLSRLPSDTNKALAAAAVVGSRFAVDLVERVVDQDLVDAFDEACKAGIVIEEPGGRYRFNHALIRQSLLAELPSVRRMRLHQRIATTLENEPGAEDELLAELAHHYFECAWAGNAAKAVEYCRRAADQAMARLAYEGAADLYDHALHALEEIDDELPDREDRATELLVARCEALLAAGDVVSAAGAVTALQRATRDSARIAAWAACYEGQLSMLVHPERLDSIESTVSAAADTLAELDDAAGEATAHTVRALCLARLGRIGDSEIALDRALTAARRARQHRRVNAVLAVAPLAALWGPNPVPRAGGRCLDVVRLLRITTDSPAVEATSTRCQAVLEAFRGRAAAARRMIESARRTVSELGLRHALLEVEQFAGIVELVVDDSAAAEPYLRKAYNGFRRLGLDADTAETAALLGRACLALDRETEAEELCSESERLAGHALKASIAWRTLRAHLLSRSGAHDEARRFAEAAIALAERTDALVDHGDACLTLATVLNAAGDDAGGRAAAGQAIDLYERKGAPALVEMASRVLTGTSKPVPSAPAPESGRPEVANECTRVGEQMLAAVNREDWSAVEQLLAPDVTTESRRKIVGFEKFQISASQWPVEMRRYFKAGIVQFRHEFVAVRGEGWALARLQAGTGDAGSSAPRDELLQVIGLDAQGRIAQQVWFDIEDIDAAIAELDAMHLAPDHTIPQKRRLENAATRASDRHGSAFVSRDWTAVEALLAPDFYIQDRRPTVNAGLRRGRDAEIEDLQASAAVGFEHATAAVIATRGRHLALTRGRYSGGHDRPFENEVLHVVEIDSDERIAAVVVFETTDINAAFEELDARYIVGEAAPYAGTWQAVTQAYSALNQREMPVLAAGWVDTDHRSLAAIGPGDLVAYIRAAWDDLASGGGEQRVEAVHRLDTLGGVVTHTAHGISHEGVDAEWRMICVFTVADGLLNRLEIFDEADLEKALARFDELHPRPRELENAASRSVQRYLAHYAARDWDSMAEALADAITTDDRRRVLGAGLRHGREAAIADQRVIADLGVDDIVTTVVAIRGEHLSLLRTQFIGGDLGQEAINETLAVVETDTEERIAAHISFDVNDFVVAIAELESRYLAGEAAPFADTWSPITRAFAALNRHELDGLPRTTPQYQVVDHRLHATIDAADLVDLFGITWDLTPDLVMYVEAVHRLDDLGAVITQGAYGTSPQGFDAQWRMIQLLTVQDQLGTFCELFDEADLDAALARFDELHTHEPRLENAASRAHEHANGLFEKRDWTALAETLAPDVCDDDRRRITNSGLIRGPEHIIANSKNAAALGATHISMDVIATRGDRLVLGHLSYYGDQGPEAFSIDVLSVTEIGLDGRCVAYVAFDPEDFEAAVAELDTRYLAGEGAAHACTWSSVVRCFASINRRELPETRPDWVNVDHRRAASIESGELTTFLSTTWDSTPELTNYIQTVHRLSDIGTVITHAARSTFEEGFDAEWRVVNLFIFEGEQVRHLELFDEAQLDEALARFDQLCRPEPRLLNSASQVAEQFYGCFADRDLDALAKMLAGDMYLDDRRKVVGAGIQRGREANLADLRVIAKLKAQTIKPVALATRGERLVLSRVHFAIYKEELPEYFNTEALRVVELNADNRITAVVIFDLDDLDAAFAELDARYLAGEAAEYKGTWCAVTEAYAAFNRHELFATTPDWVNVDHRRGIGFAPGEMVSYLRASWDVTPDIIIRIEAVHRLSDLGAVVTHATQGTSQEGFDAEWRVISLLTAKGGLIDRCERFDENDLDAALARFDELEANPRRPENSASRVDERLWSTFARRDWAAMGGLMINEFVSRDHRRVVNSGILCGSEAIVANMRAVADVGVQRMTSTVIATRGERLCLTRVRSFIRGAPPDEFSGEVLSILEIDADSLLTSGALFDVNDLVAAAKELDTRFRAGEGRAHAHTWSLITRAFEGFNRGELPAWAEDGFNVDHRYAAAMAPGDGVAYFHASWELAAQLSVYIESVHRLTDLGAVFTHVGNGTSREGFEAEWRTVGIMTVVGDVIRRGELFDEAELHAALARFEELSPSTPRLESTASQAYERIRAMFSVRDFNAITELLSEDVSTDDRRRVINSGIRKGRDAVLAELHSFAAIGAQTIASDVVATRGDRLSLQRSEIKGIDGQPGKFDTTVLDIIETDADKRVLARIVFDVDDLDAAIAELDARYLAGEGAAHAQTWSVITSNYTAFNHAEVPMSNWVNIDHRKGTPFAAIELSEMIRGVKALTPDLCVRIEAVHRLDDFGTVITNISRGTSEDGFDAEWRMIQVIIVDGDRVTRCELFDEADIEAALRRFEVLRSQEPRLENAATRNWTRMADAYNRRDLDGFLSLAATDGSLLDCRQGLHSVQKGPAMRQNLQAMLDVSPDSWRMVLEPIAERGARLSLTYARWVDDDQADHPATIELLSLMEVNDHGLMHATVSFDPGDMDAAFEELEARYGAGEAADHAHTWSVITRGYAALNRHELAPTADNWASLDHRRGVAFSPGDLPAYLRAGKETTSDGRIHIETVHRISSSGAVVTQIVKGTSQDGFDAEWREICVMIIGDDALNCLELFDEGALSAALERFDELHIHAMQLGNLASESLRRFRDCFCARDWDAIAETVALDFAIDDRRLAVNSGIERGRSAVIERMRVTVDPDNTNVNSTIIATRGERLVLTSAGYSGSGQEQEAFRTELLSVVETDADGLLTAQVIFDRDDMDAAFNELEARYLTGEAADYVDLWSEITQSYAAMNRHEIPATMADWVTTDHRVRQSFEGGELTAYAHSAWDLIPDVTIRIETVHRLTDFGAAYTHVACGTSEDGFDAEWRMVVLLSTRDERRRCELYDEADLSVALTAFGES